MTTAIRSSPGYPNYAVCSSCNRHFDNLTKIYFSARWLVRADVHNRDTLVPAEIEFSIKIGTIPPNSRLLDTLQGLRGSGSMLLRKKLEICGLQTAGNAMKLSILPPLRYFCISLNLLRSHQGDHFGK